MKTTPGVQNMHALGFNLLAVWRRSAKRDCLRLLREGGFLMIWTVAICARGGVELSVLASFDRAKGSFPECVLVQGTDGSFYGTTHFGGTNGSPSGYGTVFRVTTNGVLTALTSFAGTNGSGPAAGLVQDGDGSLYGTTYGDGLPRYTHGSVFKIGTDGGLTNLVVFNGLNGGIPKAALIRSSDGHFYGTTSNGGKNGYGTVFKMSANGVLTNLAAFGNTNGGSPSARLLQDGAGNFFGTTAAGGANGGYGTVFKLGSNGMLTTLVAFANTNGARPFSGLVFGDDGWLYGTTRDGGTADQGTVYKISTAGNLTTLVSFDGTNGAQPYAELLKGRDGNFYGTTSRGGENNQGTVFMMKPGGSLITLASFAGTNGARPYAGLIQGADGDFYGTTANGGSTGNGTVFHFQMPLLIRAVSEAGDGLKITWGAVIGKTYQIQFSSDLTLSDWNDFGSAITATNDTMAVLDSIDFGSQRFYRVVRMQ